MVRVAVLSTAHIHTKSFLENLAGASDGRSARLIWDDVDGRGRRYADAFGVRFEPSLEQALSDPEVDAFLICAENTRHRTLLEKTLPRGKPILCEKPLVTTDEDGRAVAAIAARHPDTPLFCGYFQPFSAAMRGIARELAAGTFGKITHVRAVNAHHAAYGRWFDNPDLQWFVQPALSGGGALMDMGTHMVHLLRTLLGPVVEVWADAANRSGAYPEVDDFGVMHLRFASGVFGTVEAGWVQSGGVGGLSLSGSRAALWNTADGYRIGGPGESPRTLIPDAPRPDRVDRLAAAARKELSAGELAEDRAAVFDAAAIMAAAYRSAREGGWIGIEAWN